MMSREIRKKKSKISLKMSTAKRRPLHIGLNVVTMFDRFYFKAHMAKRFVHYDVANRSKTHKRQTLYYFCLNHTLVWQAGDKINTAQMMYIPMLHANVNAHNNVNQNIYLSSSTSMPFTWKYLRFQHIICRCYWWKYMISIRFMIACLQSHYRMMSSNGNIFRVTGPLCGEIISRRWIPLTKSIDAGLWCFFWSATE